MKTENNKGWMVWAIVILAVMNISTFLTIVFQRNKALQPESVLVPDMVQSESASLKYSGRYFRDQLNLSRIQMDRFTDFNPEFRQQAREINLELTRKRNRMLSEMAAQNSDNIKLDMLSDSIGYLHANLKKLTYRYYLDIKNICNKQQQQQLEQLFEEMFASDLPMGQYGRGGPNGRRYGRRFNN
jgi:Spy/CpxP family protein refolding chaperone